MGFLSLSLSALAQETGTITGRVFNPYTGQNVRYAEVSLVDTLLVTVTDADGIYRFNNVPAGKATLTLLFTGYELQSVEIEIKPGEILTRDFNLKLPASEIAGAKTNDDDIVQLAAFVVSGQREGNAKAIMAQRASQNISNVVASDAFGDVAEGNVGEFLKNMPGVDLDYVEADTRTPRLRGLPSQYTSVTMDGGQVASADAFTQFNSVGSGTGDSARSFGFEQVSINSIESIEVNKTAGADFDAEGAAGTINMKTKRAFDRQGRRITFSAALTANSEEMNLNQSYGPDDSKQYKTLPSYTFEYSDILLNKRLGIILNVSESNSFTEQRRLETTYNRTPTTIDSRPVVITRLDLRDGPKTTKRGTVTLTADYKFSPKLDFGGGIIWSRYEAGIYNRLYRFNFANASNRADVQTFNGSDPLLGLSTNSATPAAQRTVGVSNPALVKLTHTLTTNARARYRSGNLEVETKGTYSHSVNDYEAIVRGTVRDAATNITGVGFTATRTSLDDANWKVVQTSGADLAELSNYTTGASAAPRITEEARWADVAVYSSQVDATYKFDLAIPTSIKTGVKWLERHNRYENTTPLYTWDYYGAGGGLNGSFGAYTSPHISEFGSTGVELISISGRPLVAPDRNRLASLFISDPSAFRPVPVSTTNYYNALVANPKNYRENVNAAYIMATSKFKRLDLSVGVRFENTRNTTRERNGRTVAETKAAGHGFTNAIRPNSIDGITFQYLSRPDITRVNDYDDLFLSTAAKYNITNNLQFQAGFNQGIQRPRFIDVTGAPTEDDEENLKFSVPNKKLKPEYFNNYVTRLQYYFEPVGSFGISAYQIDGKNSMYKTDYTGRQFTEQFPEESPYTIDEVNADTAIANAVFRRKDNSPGNTRFRGLEVEYSQQLTFLPGILRGIDVRGAYTRNYARVVRQATLLGLSPHYFTGAVGFKYRDFYTNLSAKWNADTPFEAVRTEFGNRSYIRDERTMYDLNMSYRLSSKFSLFLQGRNILNEQLKVYEPAIGATPALLWRVEDYGALWTAGIRGTF
jgi:TonB-dependent receptor